MPYKVKYLHIILPNEEESLPIVQFFNENFNKDEHVFFSLLKTTTRDLERLREIDNVFLYLQGKTRVHKMKYFYDLLNNAEHIIWHGLYLQPKHVYFLSFFTKFLKKSIWVGKGTDLFGWGRDIKTVKGITRIKNKIYNYFGKRIRRLIPNFVALFPQDKNVYLNVYNPHGKVLESSFWNFSPIKIEMISYENVNETVCTKILVGHSAYPWNNHIAVLDSLAKFRYENIKLYIPLGYGSSERYKKKVSDYADKLFGEKAICISEELSSDELSNLIKDMDIIILHKFHSSVQIKLDLPIVMSSLYMNKKVYLPSGTRLYKYLCSKGLRVYDSKTILDSEFNTFKSQLKNSRFDQTKIETFSISDEINKWNKFFKELKVMDNKIRLGKEKIKFLHIIRPSESVSYSIIKIINDNFNKEEHKFLINRRVPLETCGKLMQFEIVDFFIQGATKIARIKYFYNRLNNADHIIWHGLYAGYGKLIMEKKELFFLSFFNKFLKKITWVPWGMDLYEWKVDTSELRGIDFIKATIGNMLSRLIRENVANVVTIFPPDAEGYKEQFNSDITIFDGSYSAPNFIEDIERTRPIHRKNSKYINILLGHTANPWNKHFEALNNLSKFRDENIRIYIPLSYGVDRDYANSVKEYANKLFGNKAICIFREMNLENYIRFLWSIDVAYFLLERQAALGNLMRLIYMGKRIYLPSNTVMYDFFRSQDIDIADANTVIQKTFDEFIKPINNTTPPQYILDRTNPNKVVEKWRYIFNTLSNDTKKHERNCKNA